MSHLYKASEWEDACGRFHVNDTSDLRGNAGKWWTPMRMLGLTVERYIDLLLSYNASRLKYNIENDVLMFSFDKLADARKFKNFLNKKARELNYIV